MISFVGAGPGAADLITLRGAQRLAAADVVDLGLVARSRGAPRPLPAGDHVHDSATMTLEDVLAVYAGNPDAADRPAPLGRPLLYGAIGEQIDWCLAHERSWEIVPGVTVAGGGRGRARPGADRPQGEPERGRHPPGRAHHGSMPTGEGVAAFAAHGATMAVFLSAARPEELDAELLAPGSGYRPTRPAAIVIRATWPDERIIRTTVGALAADLEATGATMTVLVLVGDALADGRSGAQPSLRPVYTTAFRLRSSRARPRAGLARRR